MDDLRIVILLLVGGLTGAGARASEGEAPVEVSYPSYAPAPKFQTEAEAQAKSDGCVSCHTDTDQRSMHESEAVVLGCTDCHGAIHGSYTDEHLRH